MRKSPQKNPLMLLLVIALFVLFLTGCSISYPVVGSFDDYNEVFLGNVDHNLTSGTHYVVATGQDSGMICKGPGRVVHIPNAFGCAGQRGITNLICSDGRTIEAHWVAETCSSGYGSGVDKDNNKFTFTFGMPQEEALAKIKSEMTFAQKRPAMPTYNPKELRKEKGYSTGTGFFVNNHGTFITNYHVIEDAKQVTLVSSKGESTNATVLTFDKANDIALLQADVVSKPIPLASKTYNNIGDEVVTLGYPMVQIQGQNLKATFGRINSLSGIKDDVRFLQIDVPVQPGNSGGPLINKNGEVIGIVTMTLNQTTTLKESGHLPQNVNFASKIDYALPLLTSRNDLKIIHMDGKEAINIPEIVKRYSDSVILVISR